MRTPAHPTGEPRIRAFLALAPPREILDQIGLVQKRLKQQWRVGVRWVNSNDLHLTLKFFGGITAREIGVIRAAVGEVTVHAAPLALTACQLGVFSNTKKPRVIWLGLQGDVAPLNRLQRDIDVRLAGCGFDIEARPFRPHLTLGRLKAPQTLSGLEDFVAQGAEFAAGSFVTSELVLMKSELTPQGAVHTALERFPLRAFRGAEASCPIIKP